MHCMNVVFWEGQKEGKISAFRVGHCILTLFNLGCQTFLGILQYDLEKPFGAVIIYGRGVGANREGGNLFNARKLREGKISCNAQTIEGQKCSMRVPMGGF